MEPRKVQGSGNQPFLVKSRIGGIIDVQINNRFINLLNRQRTTFSLILDGGGTTESGSINAKGRGKWF